jgi:hypothetical protein
MLTTSVNATLDSVSPLKYGMKAISDSCDLHLQNRRGHSARDVFLGDTVGAVISLSGPEGSSLALSRCDRTEKCEAGEKILLPYINVTVCIPMHFNQPAFLQNFKSLVSCD